MTTNSCIYSIRVSCFALPKFSHPRLASALQMQGIKCQVVAIAKICIHLRNRNPNIPPSLKCSKSRFFYFRVEECGNQVRSRSPKEVLGSILVRAGEECTLLSCAGVWKLAVKKALGKQRQSSRCTYPTGCVDLIRSPPRQVNTGLYFHFPLLANMLPAPNVSRSRNRFSLADFELPSLQDPREGWERAFPARTQNDGSQFSTSNFESRNLIDKLFDEDIEFPEGGRRAWFVVFGSWCALFSSLGLMNTLGVFEKNVSTHQLRHLDAATVGWIFSLYAFCTFGIGLFVGPLFDKYGPKWLLLGGSVLAVLSMDLIGNCNSRYLSLWTNLLPPLTTTFLEFWHFIVYFSILGGVGSALLFSPSIAIIGYYFSRRRGYATGIAAIGGASGGILYPLIIQLLTPSIGFLWPTKLIALISLVLCGFANVFMQPLQAPGPTINAWPNLLILRHTAFALTILGVFLLEFAIFAPLTYMIS